MSYSLERVNVLIVVAEECAGHSGEYDKKTAIV